MIEYESLKRVNQPYIEELKSAFGQVLDSGWFILGQQVEAFEKEYAEFNKVKYCAGVASGLDALTISLIALDLPASSEIIVPSNTYIATILAIIHSGHKPVLVEPNIRTCNIDPSLLERAITSKTKAVIVVHLYGKPCEMDPIVDICRQRNLFLVEDCAQAHGAEYKGKMAGTFGHMAAFSFYPTKNLGCLGDGGAILTNNPDYYEKIRMIRNYGSKKKYYNEYVGVNSRLDELQAAFLRIKLRDLRKVNSHKRALANLYHEGLSNEYVKPVIHPDYHDVYHIFNIRHPKRDELREYLLENGVKTEIHYPVPPHRQKALTFMSSLNLPLSDSIHNTTLSLPISACHTPDEVVRVIELINSKRFR